MRTFLFTALVGLAGGAALTLSPSLYADEETNAPSADEIRAWIEMLGSSDFAAREKASKQLADLGEGARAALEQAAEASDSLETRWRAEQLLRRLEGQTTRRLGEPGREATDKPRVELDALRGRLSPEWIKKLEDMLGGVDSDEMKRLMKEYEKAMGELGVEQERVLRLVPQLRDMFDGARSAPGTTKAPGLTLIRKLDGTVELRIDNRDDPSQAPRVLRGADLDSLVKTHPDVLDHPGFAELRNKVNAPANPFGSMLDDWRRKLRVPSGGTMPGLRSHVQMNGISIATTPEGTTVKVKERGEDGQVVEKTYTGKNLEEIKAKHPELAERLGGNSFELHIGPPTILREYDTLRDALRRFRRPVTPPVPRTTTPGREGPFGIVISDVPAALAYQLELDAGTGVLVQSVRAGSPAAELGLEKHDILVQVNGQDVVDPSAMVRTLRAAGSDRSVDLELVVIRRGGRTVLVR